MDEGGDGLMITKEHSLEETSMQSPSSVRTDMERRRQGRCLCLGLYL
jgi:hypothetical protein